MWIVRSLTDKKQQRRNSQTTILYIILGFSLLVVPYGKTLYSQTGQSILTQHFRMGDYVVTQSQATQVIQQQEAPDLLKKLNPPPSTGKEDYKEIYIQRRVMRELLPDSSEMYGYIVKERQEREGVAEIIWEKLISKPGLVVTNLTKNFRYLKDPIGNILPYFFLLTVISAFFIKIKNKNTYARRLLPTFLVAYLIIISFFTGVIDRYVHIIFGLVLAHTMTEAYLLIDRFLLINVTNKQRVLGILLLFSATLLLIPRLFTTAVAKPKIGEHANLFGNCSRFVKNSEEQVFSIHPADAYLVGGRFYILPNDSLEKIAQYAHKIGVRWLIIKSNEQNFYTMANWLKNKNLEKDYSDLLTLRCKAERKLIYLYEFKSISDR